MKLARVLLLYAQYSRKRPFHTNMDGLRISSAVHVNAHL